MYHPGGIDYDGRHIWVPVAEYRPNSRSIIYRVPVTQNPVWVEARNSGLRAYFMPDDDKSTLFVYDADAK